MRMSREVFWRDSPAGCEREEAAQTYASDAGRIYQRYVKQAEPAEPVSDQGDPGYDPRGKITAVGLQHYTYDMAVKALLAPALDDLRRGIVDAVARALDVDYCELLELDYDDERFVLRAGAGFAEGTLGTHVGIHLESQAGYTLLRRRPVIVENLAEEHRFDDHRMEIDHGVVSGVTIPICARDSQDGATCCFGVLGIHTRSRRRFENEEVQFLVEMGHILGSAYEAHSRERRKQQELEIVRNRAEQLEAHRAFDGELLEILSTADDEEAVAACAARMAVPFLADWCFVDLLDGTSANGSRRVRRRAVGHPDASPESSALAHQLVGHYPINLRGQQGTPKVLRTRRSELIRDVDDSLLQSIARDETGLNLLRGLKPRSYLGIPLYSNSQLAGVLVLLRDGASSTRYGKSDLELAERYALVLSLALTSVTNRCDHFDPHPNGQESTISHADPDEDLLPLLSPRQREVFEHLADLKSNQEIGDTLFLSVNTIKSHVFRSRQVFGLEDRPALVRKARALLKGD